jgi:hypothetical protein
LLKDFASGVEFLWMVGVWGKQISQISKAHKWRSGQFILRMKKKCLKLILLRRSKFSKSLFSRYDSRCFTEKVLEAYIAQKK